MRGGQAYQVLTGWGGLGQGPALSKGSAEGAWGYQRTLQGRFSWGAERSVGSSEASPVDPRSACTRMGWGETDKTLPEEDRVDQYSAGLVPRALGQSPLQFSTWSVLPLCWLSPSLGTAGRGDI